MSELKQQTIEQMEKFDMYQTPKNLTDEIVKKYKEFYPDIDEVQEPCVGYGVFCKSFLQNGIDKIHLNDIQMDCVIKTAKKYKYKDDKRAN